jgi:hypothetical protein
MTITFHLPHGIRACIDLDLGLALDLGLEAVA